MSESLSDVKFLVPAKAAEPGSHCGDDLEQIPAHKLILSIGSPVFKAMFYGTGSRLEPSQTVVSIPDLDAGTFRSMLRHMYTDEMESAIGPDSVMSLLYCAKKYAVESLERECVGYLERELRPDNAFFLLEQALMFDTRPLVEACLSTIDSSCGDACSADCFLDTAVETLALVLQRDSLAIREYDLFQHLIRWAESRCLRDGLPVNRENKRF